MKRHGIARLYVLQYEFPALDDGNLRPVAADEVASVNTHDMPPFAAFWQGLDIQEWFELGLLDFDGLQRERRLHGARKQKLVELLHREGWLPNNLEKDLQKIHLACQSFLAASAARTVLLNAEDLWLETRPQNFPGTGEERDNWRRKTADRLEAWRQSAEVRSVLQTVNALRRK